MLTFEFFATEPEAREFCTGMNRRSKAHYTPWQSSSETDPMHYIAWYETTPQKAAYEVREIDAWAEYDDPDDPEEEPAWIWNTSYRLGEFTTAGDPARAFRHYLKTQGVTFRRGATRTEYDGDVYEIVDRKTGAPIYAAIPKEF